jgi:hypothetical protein
VTDRRLLAAIVSIGLLNMVALWSAGLLQSYDAQTHLFFADHYLKAWWDPWEPRWFDGMWVISYPPLVHQLIAAIGAITDLDLGYRIVQAVSLLLLPVAVRQLALETVGPRYAGWAALLAVAVPGVYIELYTWGQLPSFVGSVLSIGAAAYFGRYLRTGKVLALATCAALTGAATGAHHHSVIFIMPPLMTGMVLRWWLRRRPPLRVALLRPLVSGLVCAVLGAATILPFWWWYATQNLPQAELPHPSRDGIFGTRADAELFFWGVYGALLVLAPIGLAMLLTRRRSWWPLAAVIVLLGTLGLGTLTPLPQILFGYKDLWRWLVYERFAIWAAVLCTLPASVFVERLSRTRVRWPAGIAVAVVLLLGVARESTFTQTQPVLPHQLLAWEEGEILKFLANDNHAEWNYMTLGLGDAEMARISRLTSARTMDGLYYTARVRPELRASGVGSIDTAYWWRTGLEILPQVIAQPDRWNLKWAIVAIPKLQEQLQAAGWQKLYTLGSPGSLVDVSTLFFQQSAETQAAFRATYGDQASLAWAAEHGTPAPVSLVSVWEAPAGLDIPRLPPVVTPAYPALLPVWWGTVPLLFLALATTLVLLQVRGQPKWRLSLSLGERPRHRAPARPRVAGPAEVFVRGLAGSSIAGRFMGTLLHWAGL